MSVVTVTMTVGTTCHYWFEPQANVSVSGAGVSAPSFLEGFIYDNSPLSVSLDASYHWDVYLEFRNAPPITFLGFIPGTGGDLLELLSAQGWTP